MTEPTIHGVPRCTCQASPGEHPHTVRGCDVPDCGCRWTPPPVDGEEPIRREGSIHVIGALAPDEDVQLPSMGRPAGERTLRVNRPAAAPTDGSAS